MKVTDIQTMVLQVELAQPSWSVAALSAPASARAASTRAALLVRVFTDEGLVGLGQAHAGPANLPAVRSAVEAVVKHYVVGQDPFFVERIWDSVYRGTFQDGRKGTMISALSGVDIALWDILGQAAGLPIYKLLGASRDRVVGYATGGFYGHGVSPGDLAAEIASYAERGFRAAKIKIGGAPLKDDLERMKAAREGAGDRIRVMADANRAYDPKMAIRVARHLEELDYDWFEEPVSPDDVEGSAMVAAATSVPIAGYETENTVVGFKELITRRAVDIVQPDLVWSGGFTECRKIASLAAAWGMSVCPHAYSSALTLVAGLHLAGSAPNVAMMEMDQTPNPLIGELLTEPIELDAEGYVAIPSRPGLGVELNEEAVQRYRVG